MSGRAGSWSGRRRALLHGHVPMGGQKGGQIARDRRIGGKRQAELLKARPPADRLLVQAHARKETLDQQVADFLRG